MVSESRITQIQTLDMSPTLSPSSGLIPKLQNDLILILYYFTAVSKSYL
ncbi:hypothetical protein SAMN05444001_11627 [Parabacteroides chinchillae]|uniref:Uncharacterized protein n=1 Tax=Parabacteroides chinchillae TaxID=871327 RepID=A0A8G2BY13_9BACT|nr:hypothetical protein SAMN05444001_11627 [Parabacteroides chinchillae]